MVDPHRPRVLGKGKEEGDMWLWPLAKVGKMLDRSSPVTIVSTYKSNAQFQTFRDTPATSTRSCSCEKFTSYPAFHLDVCKQPNNPINRSPYVTIQDVVKWGTISQQGAIPHTPQTPTTRRDAYFTYLPAPTTLPPLKYDTEPCRVRTVGILRGHHRYNHNSSSRAIFRDKYQCWWSREHMECWSGGGAGEGARSHPSLYPNRWISLPGFKEKGIKPYGQDI